MAQQNINLGTTSTGADGDTARTAWNKAQENFSELYKGLNIFGLFSQRPDPSSVALGAMYYASDTLEAYRSTGAGWVLASRGGAELGHAERTTPFTMTSDSFTDIPGLALDYIAGDSAAFISYGGTCNSGSTSATPPVTTSVVALFVDGVQISQILVSDGNFRTYSTGVRVTGKAAGSTVQVRVKARQSNTPGVFTIFGDSVDRPFLRVVNG